MLAKHPGLEGVLERVIAEARGSNSNAARNFTVLLAAFDRSLVDRAIAKALGDPETGAVAELLRSYLNGYSRGGNGNELFVAGYASDTIDVGDDRLGIQEDVQTLTAVMLAKEVKPPLAIGLFGDWGSGKSFFMQSLRAAGDALAKRAQDSDKSPFCSNIVPIEFNAWHYADTNLYASLVSYILEKLAAHVTPQRRPEEQQAALLKELGSTKTVVAEAEAEKKRAQELIAVRQDELQKLQLERQQKEVKLRDLRGADLQALLLNDKRLKQEIETSLEQIGVPAALNSIADLSQVVAEAYTVRGRLTALFLTILNTKQRVLWVLLPFVMFVIPLIAYLVHEYLIRNDLIVFASTVCSQVVVVLAGIATVLRQAVGQVKANLDRVEAAKQQVDELIADKRKNPTIDELELQKEIASLNAKEQGAASRLSAATARVLELEEHIRSIEEGRSLAWFLSERTRSEDYRKYLGLISTIRRDFESLGERLASPAGLG